MARAGQTTAPAHAAFSEVLLARGVLDRRVIYRKALSCTAGVLRKGEKRAGADHLECDNLWGGVGSDGESCHGKAV